MAEPRRIDRLTAQDLLMLWPDELGWPEDIGALAILDGTSLLDRDGRVRIEAVRRHLEPRLALVPRFRQLLYRPRRGLGWPLWVDAPAFDLADHVRVHPLAAPGDQAQLLQACQELARRRLDPARPLWQLWLLPRPARATGGRVHNGPPRRRRRPRGSDRLRGAAGPDRPGAESGRAAVGRPDRSRPPASCRARACGGAGRNWAAGGRAWPTRAGRCAGPERPGQRSGRGTVAAAVMEA
jgi:hypothetical protein